jgi:replicative DNA helicase
MGRQSAALSEAHLRLFFAILIQNESVFNSLKSRLTAEHFEFEGYQLVFHVALNYHAENNSLPGFAEITSDIATHIENGDVDLSDEDTEILEEFLEYAFDPLLFGSDGVSAPKIETFAHKVAQKLLIGKLQKSTLTTLRNSDVTDMLSIFKEAQSQIESLQALSVSGSATYTLETGWDSHDITTKTTTGIGFLDVFLGGGTQRGEAYGVMAPFGSYKTTLAVMLWGAAAIRSHTDAITKNNGRKGLSVFVSYEAALKSELQHRLLMYAAQVRRDRLENMGYDGLGALSTDANNPLDYEHVLFKDKIDAGIFEPERVRIEKLVPIINSHTFCLDYSGSVPANVKASTEGIPAIVSGINAELKRRGPEYYVDTVIIDYIGMMVDRDATIPADLRLKTSATYQQAGMALSTNVAKYFDCPVWAFHQLSGEANAVISPTKVIHHTDAKGSRSFAENLAFCMVGGQLTADSKGQIACTKHRRAGRTPPVLIAVDGMFNKVSVLHDHQVDRAGKIVHKSQLPNSGAQQAVSPVFHLPSDENLADNAGGFEFESEEANLEQVDHAID